jgi:glucokinase
MLPFKEVIYTEIKKGVPALLVADIGGTNSNFGIAQIVDGDAKMLFSIHFKSQEITSFTDVVKDLLDYIHKKYALTIKSACFAAAGVVAPKQNFCKPTNLDITIDAKDIMKQTDLTCAFIVNDFDVVGFGVNRLEPKDLVIVQRGNEYKHGNKAILGAGTGLGKSILRWSSYKERYLPVPSEGGHADFAAQTQLELDLIKFIQEREKYCCNISWENVLSGKGIKRIYAFFGQYKKYANEDITLSIDGPHPDEIFNSRNRDKRCWDTFELYAKLYGRCAKNWALDALALGGVYIAGGIASHNVDMFKLDVFLKEFANCGKQQLFLKSMPVWVIADYDVSLYGAIEYMRLEGKCKI